MASGTPQPVNGEFRINTQTTSSQYDSSMAALADGGFVVTWSSNGQDGSSAGVYGQRYDASGNKSCSEFRINTYNSDLQYDSAVAALNDGGYVVTWSSQHQDGSGWGVYGQRYDAEGNAADSEFRVNTTTTDRQSGSAVTALADGYLITWNDFGQGGTYGQLYDAAGEKSGGEFRLNTTSTDSRYGTTVTALDGGGFVATWTSYGSAGLYGQRYDAAGDKSGSQFRLNTETDDLQYDSAVTALPSGGFVATWTSDGQDGDESGIYGQRYDEDGNALGGEFRVNTTRDDWQFESAVTALAGGGFVVTWSSNGQDGASAGIYGQRYDANGNRLGSETLLNHHTDDAQSGSAVTALTGGDFVVTWNSQDQDDDDWGIYGQRFGFTGQTLTGTAAADTLSGAGDNDTLNGGAGADSLRGNAGNDLYVVDNAGDVITEATSADVDTVQSSITMTLSANLENLTLTGSSALNGTGNASDNILVGNSAVNTLTGLAGDDTLDGGGDADILIGGDGDDTYRVNHAGDVVTEAADAGSDLLESAITKTLSANLENLTLTGSSDIDGTGNDGANLITGNRGANTLTGGDGNDILDGGAGIDLLRGGLGNDTLVVDDADDVVAESADQGEDTVKSFVTWTLGATVENLTLAGCDAIDGAGNSGANTLTGNRARNTLAGGAGNDIYVVQNASDVVVEQDGAGNDLIKSTLSWTLGAHQERLTLIHSADTTATGNELNNTLTGNRGHNTLDGMGGADIMAGGAGNDTYVVNNSGDSTTEAVDEGTDLVKSSITWTLAANVDNLTLTGSDDLDGTGNADDNVLTGNSGDNRLTGGDGKDTMSGGAGSDTYVGGLGNDTYKIADAGDTVVEYANEGTDTVESSRTWTLGNNQENLTLTGDRDIDGTGNGLDNTLTGNTGLNTLTGGAGDDTYVVHNSGDVPVERANQGTDEVRSYVNWTLGDNLENLVLKTDSDLKGTGNDLNNVITGNRGANSLDGAGGADSLAGGVGNDTYLVNNTGDVATENGDEGTDLVKSSITWTLGANLENLTLLGSSAIDGTGNTLDNIITGNSGNNGLNGGDGDDTLDGMLGGDAMAGGDGNDTYVVNNSGDSVTENASEGTDLVQSSRSWTLSANVENLTLTGSEAVNGTGNTLNNTITGNSAANTLNGDDGADTLDGKAGADTLRGGDGDDTYLVSSTSDRVAENSNAGTDLVKSSVTWTLGSNLENLTLTGDKDINGTGNSLGNTLTGNSGLNTLAGGTGNDTYIAGSDDKLVESAGQGTDLVESAITWTLATNLENLTLTGTSNVSGTGNSANNVLTGNSAANTLSGRAGNDTLESGGGGDTLMGGEGDDTYLVASGDTVRESADEGTDVVESAITWTLSSNVENLTLTGESAVNGTGNSGDNTFTGNSGVNTLSGGAGNDTYVAGLGDRMVENSDEGTDLVRSAITWTLDSNVENLTLTGSEAVNGTGNSSANILTGNGAINTLSGAAGSDTLYGMGGADTLLGGSGNDYYVITSSESSATISENANEGTDLVQSAISWVLADNVENITLSGSSNIDATGNIASNVLTGNSGRNYLRGGNGDDTYVVTSGDTVYENAGEGADVVQSAITWTLSADVETLVLTGADDVNGTGNTSDNTLTGNGGANTLSGDAGTDTLTGGSGADRFRFTAPGNGSDIVADFTASQSDKLVFTSANFGGLSQGTLGDSRFIANSTGAATDTEQRFVFNTTSRVLSYDSDGSGDTVAVNIATLTGVSSLAASSILIS